MRFLLPPSRTVRAEARADAPPFDRYTGVLYRALGASEWTPAERRWAARHVCVHAGEHGVVPGAGPCSPALDLNDLAASAGPLVDLRSKEYVRRAPLPDGQWTVRVVSEGADGRRLAVSHWNKYYKGVVLGALVRSRPRLTGIRSLLTWAAATGIRLEQIGPESLDLVVRPGERAPDLATEAAAEVVVHHSDGLHEGIHRGRAHESDPELFESSRGGS